MNGQSGRPLCLSLFLPVKIFAVLKIVIPMLISELNICIVAFVSILKILIVFPWHPVPFTPNSLGMVLLRRDSSESILVNLRINWF